MGNSPSTPAHRPHNSSLRTRPLKSKKRSILDHPPILIPAPPSQPIPIPSNSGHQSSPRPPPPPPNDSFSLDILHRDEHSTHRPIQYNSTRSFGQVPSRRAHQGSEHHQQQPPRPASPASFVPEIVHSTLPIRLPQQPEASSSSSASRPRRPKRQSGGSPANIPSSPSSHSEHPIVSTRVVWRGGGKEVFVAGTFDPLEWRARERMRFDPATSTHSLTLLLTPGTYRLKFLVDSSWRCSDDFPTATDDTTGNLVNYIDVEDSAALDPAPIVYEERQGTVDARVMKANRRRTYHPPPHPRYHPPQLPPSESAFWDDPDTDTEIELEGVAGWERGRDGVLERWSSEIPPSLLAAAQQEEAYVAAVQAQRRRDVPAPAIPPAPRLPRHLDKVLLNARSAGGASGDARRGASSRSRLGMTALLPPPTPPPPPPPAPPAPPGSLAAMEQQADDSSVLPVPNHVVLHHLGTSAIKNGVLAVSDTTRYDKKYITTIYYKPA